MLFLQKLTWTGALRNLKHFIRERIPRSWPVFVFYPWSHSPVPAGPPTMTVYRVSGREIELLFLTGSEVRPSAKSLPGWWSCPWRTRSSKLSCCSKLNPRSSSHHDGAGTCHDKRKQWKLAWEWPFPASPYHPCYYPSSFSEHVHLKAWHLWNVSLLHLVHCRLKEGEVYVLIILTLLFLESVKVTR